MNDATGDAGSVNGSALDAERLAALLDGKLDAMDRSELLRRVADSDDAIEVLADATAVLGDAGDEQGDIVARPLERTQRWFRHPGVWMALAAAVALLAIVPSLWHRAHADTGSPLQFASAVTLATTSNIEAWPDSAWPASRGSDTPLSEGARAWRIGVRITDLALATRVSDTSAATLASDVATLVEPLPASGPVVALYGEISRAAGSHASSGALQLDAATAAGKLAGTGIVSAGAWAEAARIAAAQRDTAFFRDPASRAAATKVAQAEWTPPTVRAEAVRVVREMDSRPAPPWAELAATLSRIVALPGQ